MISILSAVNGFVWGAPALLLILGVGLYFSVRLGWVQLRLLPRALKQFFGQLCSGKREEGSSFQALCTALGATVGTGNLVGVAGAICIGGPGAVFWMWLCGLLGMVTKYAEATLAVAHRVRDKGEYLAGPMYTILGGMGNRFLPLAKAYSLCGLLAAFGVGNAAQVNAVITAAEEAVSSFGGNTSCVATVTGFVMAVLTALLLSGGAKKLVRISQALVPGAAAVYLVLCLLVLMAFHTRIPGAFAAIVQGAFDPKAVTGGALGSAFQALRIGCSRGVFTNEAGMGTAAIAHGSARVRHPARQGLMGIVEVFLDTEVICTLTALVILVSGVPVPYGTDAGAALPVKAFSAFYGKSAAVLLALMLLSFALAAILGWSFYGGQCARFLFGRDIWRTYAAAQTGVCFLSGFFDASAVWAFSETANGLMAIPNLISLAALSGTVIRLTNEYKNPA